MRSCCCGMDFGRAAPNQIQIMIELENTHFIGAKLSAAVVCRFCCCCFREAQSLQTIIQPPVHAIEPLYQAEK